MKCDCCGAEVVNVPAPTLCGFLVCNAEERLYWIEDPDCSIVTPNGEIKRARLTGELGKAHGLGRLLHSCIDEYGR